MPANWVYIITYVMVFGFAVYIGFLIGQELSRRYLVTARAYWAANIGGLVAVVLAVALIPAMMIQIILMGVLAGYIALAPKAIDGDYKPGFLVEHFLKDLGLALTVAEEKELALPGADTAFTLYDMLDAIGGGRMGTQAITLLYQEEAEAVAAGLDWSLYTAQHEHDDECDCGCGHDHGHEHGEDHECCCGGHGHGEGHECHCGHHHEG